MKPLLLLTLTAALSAQEKPQPAPPAKPARQAPAVKPSGASQAAYWKAMFDIASNNVAYLQAMLKAQPAVSAAIAEAEKSCAEQGLKLDTAALEKQTLACVAK